MGKKCPECGVDLTGQDPVGHANYHWDPKIADKDMGADALKRKKALLAGGVDTYPWTPEEEEGGE